MDIVKKNLVSVICGVVALLALVAIFIYPLPGMWAEVATSVSDRKKAADSIDSLSNTKVILPKTSLTDEPKTLDIFPTRPVIDNIQIAIDKLKRESTLTYDRAVALNTKQLMMPNLLPAPPDSMMPRFRQTYQRVMNLDRKAFDDPNTNLWIGKKGSLGQITNQEMSLNGTAAPTEVEVQSVAEQKAATIRTRLTQTQQNQVVNKDQVDAAVRDALKNVREELRAARAYSGNVYVDFDSFTPVQGIVTTSTVGGGAMQPNPSGSNAVTAYNAQVNLWVHQEFLQGVVNANAASKAVPDSPIKRIIRIDVPQSLVNVAATSMMGGQPATPTATTELPVSSSTAIIPSPTMPFGHASNSMYEVVRFTARLHIAAAKLPQIIADLQKGHLLTVTNVASIVPVDPTVMAGMGYLYGTEPVVEVVLECDVLFLRQWLVPLMPEAVKAAIAQAGAPPAQ